LSIARLRLVDLVQVRTRDENYRQLLKALGVTAEPLPGSPKSKAHRRIPVIIPAGGRGEGLYPMTYGMPKALLPTGTRPIIVRVIESLDPTIFGPIHVVAGEWLPMIEEYVKAFCPRVSVQYLEVKSQCEVFWALRSKLRSTFLVHYCDVLPRNELPWEVIRSQYKALRKKYGVGGMLLTSRHYRVHVGVVELDPLEPSLIRAFQEKPNGLVGADANIAVALFEPSLLDHVKESDRDLYGEVVQTAVKAGLQFGCWQVGEWDHVQTTQDWYEMQLSAFPHDRILASRRARA
jgi:NDP-sugar pyrophosphorylase family protein